MGVEVNWLAVILAAVSTIVVGSAWYNLKTFGVAWERLARIDPKHKPNFLRAVSLALAAALLTAYVLAHMVFVAYGFFGGGFLANAMKTAIWVWLGFSVARILMHDSFENRPVKLTLITAGHDLVMYLAMGLIIGLLPPHAAATARGTAPNSCQQTVVNGRPAESC